MQLTCMSCNKQFDGEEPQICCSGRDCGCMGEPIEPVVCSDKCYSLVMNKHKPKITMAPNLEKELLRELLYRSNLALPVCEDDEKWFNEGFDNEGDRRILLKKIYEVLDITLPKAESLSKTKDQRIFNLLEYVEKELEVICGEKRPFSIYTEAEKKVIDSIQGVHDRHEVMVAHDKSNFIIYDKDAPLPF